MAAQSQSSNLDSTELEESVEEIVEEVEAAEEAVEEVEAADEEQLNEKTLTPAEKKKREDVAKAIERDNPDMPMDKKMAIATATAKKVAEGIEDRHADAYDRVKKHLDQVKSSEHKAKFQKKFDTHLKSFDHHYEKDTGQEHHAVDDMHDLANDIKKHNTATAKKVAESSISDRTRRLIERAINRKS